MVEIIDKVVECLDALLQAGFYLGPFISRDDARYDIERENSLGALLIAVDAESDPHLQESLLS